MVIGILFIVDVVLFDFAKAFNVVSYHLLLDKLRLSGTCSPLIDWIADYIIISRVMRVLISGIRSSFMDVRTGAFSGFAIAGREFLKIVHLVTTFCNLAHC